MNDLDLLRKFEPVVHFTQGEMFYPTAVDGYLQRCSLWMRNKSGDEQMLVAEGDLSAQRLDQFKEVPLNHILFLRLIEEPLDIVEYQKWLIRPNRPSFQSGGRMVRVGIFSRILDSFIDASFLIRGNVPGGTTAAAEIKYRDLMSKDSHYVYYSRVIREGGYIVLHYIFLYFMNDFRSSFNGINDHESDWEQIFVYLSDEEEPVPLWVAYASHDFSGDDLRRRWDDQELYKFEDTHPVVYAGAGSHSSYFLPGEYLISVEPKFLKTINDAYKTLRLFWTATLGQGTIEIGQEKEARLAMPYIDYARGDGVCIGPGEEKSWTPILLREDTGWAERYRGLWGMDTRDRFDGERGPAGPKFNRDGTIRVSWYDPLGWAGLDKVPPKKLIPAKLESDISSLLRAQEEIERQIGDKRELLRNLEIEARALQKTDYLNKLLVAHQKMLESMQKELKGLNARRSNMMELQDAGKSYLEAIKNGDWGDPQAHIKVKRYPEPPLGRTGRVASYWAAVSGGLLLLLFAALFFLRPSDLIVWSVCVAVLFLAVEAAIWKRLGRFVLNVTILLAILSSLILIKDHFWQIVMIGLIGIVFISVAKNVREVIGR